jgi:hypothetical protein
LKVLDRFSEKAQISNFMKILIVGAELLHAEEQTHKRSDGRTDMTKVIEAFLVFASVPKIPVTGT